MRKTILLINTLFLLLNVFGQKTDFFLKLEKGKVYQYKYSVKLRMITEFENNISDMETTFNGSMRYLVKKVNENDYVMDLNFGSMNFKFESQDSIYEFTSENDKKTLSVILKDLIREPIEIKMAKNGKIIQVKKIDKWFDKAFFLFPNITKESKIKIRNWLKKILGPDAFKGDIELATAVYSENTIDTNKSWIVNTTLKRYMIGDIKLLYKIIDESDNYITLHGNSEIETNNNEPFIIYNGMPVKYKLKGTIISDVKVDKKTGWIKDSKIIQNYYGDYIIKENPKTPVGKTIPISIFYEIIYSN